LKYQAAQLIFFQRAPCKNQFCVIEQLLLSSKACDITGIVGMACARHGCFAPNGIVKRMSIGLF